MTDKRSPSGLEEKDMFFFKVYKVVKCEVRIILYSILRWGCPWDTSKSFDRYLKEDRGVSNKKFNKIFNDTMVEKMSKNPAGDEFDISLLYPCINHFCDGIAQSDKDALIKPIKDFRNALIHNDEIKDAIVMNDKIKEIRKMLIDALMKAKEVYKISDTEVADMISKMEDNIKKIKNRSLRTTDINVYKAEIANFRKEIEKIVENKGVPSLKLQFRELSKVDPVSFITGKQRFDVKDVYIELEIVHKVKVTDDDSSAPRITHKELLKQKSNDGKKPTVILIEGEAGSGKSTLSKFILSEWSYSANTSINGLDNYDLVLYFECKNRSIKKFIDLLYVLMPQVSYETRDRDFQISVLKKKTLIVVDAFDEINENSEELLMDMFDNCVKMGDGNLQFIITTRPQKMKGIQKLCGKFPMVHVKITGIPSERREEFVATLHNEMIKGKLSAQDTSRLIDYMKQSQCRLGDHYRLPLNLTFLTFLWADNPDSVNSVTSATQLYIAVLELLKSRVLDRFKSMTIPSADAMADFFKVLFEVYLETHKEKSMQLSAKCYQKLKHKCSTLHLPFAEMCGAFFSVDNDWSHNNASEDFYLSAPHKSIMEFFGANRIFNCLFEDDLSKDIQALRDKYKHRVITVEVEGSPKTLTAVLSSLLSVDDILDSVDLSHYHNIFIHLAGLLALKGGDGLQKYGEELVGILEKAEIDESQWLDLVAEAECDEAFSSLVAPRISNKIIVRDGHTLAALELFKHLAPNLPVLVILQTEVKYIPNIEDLMKKLSDRDCTVELILNNHWKNPENGKSTEHLKQLFEGKCRVIRFTGNLDDLKILPVDVENVRITIADDNQAKLICNDLSKLNDELFFKYIGVHVKKCVSPLLLKPLPIMKKIKKESGTLWISSVTDSDVTKTSEIIKALHPKGMKFQSLMFPRCQLSFDGFKDLLDTLKDTDVQVSKDLKTDARIVGRSEFIELTELTRECLGTSCEFQCESYVW